MNRWLIAFAVTQAVELPIYAGALRVRGWSKALGIAFGASLITHPFVWFLFPRISDNYWIYLATAEAFAIGVEALWLRRFGLRDPLLWSALANGLSAGTGFTLRQLFGWP